MVALLHTITKSADFSVSTGMGVKESNLRAASWKGLTYHDGTFSTCNPFKGKPPIHIPKRRERL